MDVRARVERDGEFSVKRVELRYGKRHSQTPREVYWRSRDVTFSEQADDLVALALLPAMARGETLVVHGAVSEQLLTQLPLLQERFRAFGPSLGHELSIIDVEVEQRISTPAAGTRAATFFSSGLDSLATTIRHHDELSGLVFVHGFDIDVRNLELRQRIARRIETTAEEFAIPLIQIETDMRSFTDRSFNWGFFYGSAVACLGLSLQEEFQRVFIASSVPLQSMRSTGSSALVDHLWSTERLEIVHDLAELNRVEKAEYVAPFEVAQRNLRVCWNNAAGEYNCGLCHKCETMQLILASLGVLDRFPVFEVPLTYDHVRGMDFADDVLRERATFCVEAIRERGGDHELLAAIQTAFRRWIAGLAAPVKHSQPEGELFESLFPPTSVKRA